MSKSIFTKLPPRPRCGISFVGVPRLTESHHKEKCSIHRIVGLQQKTGVCDHFSKIPANFGDFSDVPDFHSAMIRVTQAQQTFDALPSSVRAAFGNRISDFTAAFSNPEKAPLLQSLGLVPKPAAKPPAAPAAPKVPASAPTPPPEPPQA